MTIKQVCTYVHAHNYLTAMYVDTIFDHGAADSYYQIIFLA